MAVHHPSNPYVSRPGNGHFGGIPSLPRAHFRYRRLLPTTATANANEPMATESDDDCNDDDDDDDGGDDDDDSCGYDDDGDGGDDEDEDEDDDDDDGSQVFFFPEAHGCHASSIRALDEEKK